MSALSNARRAFACLEGNEPRVVEELRALLPGAAPLEGAPSGLVLAGDPDLDPALAIAEPVHPVFARAEFTVWGASRDADEIAAAIAESLEPGGAPPALHVWPQGSDARDERIAAAKALERLLRRRLGGRVRSKIEAAQGDEVIDVVLAGDPAAATAIYGAHRCTPLMSGFPGGQRRLRARPDAPSRAHLKLEEGLEWAALPLAKGDVAIDVGCAPGGWSLVLLERGLAVHGVDPTPVAPALAGREGFVHHRVPVARLRPERIARARWVFCDMNGPPLDALGQVARLLPRCPGLEGLFHTVKLSDDPPLPTLAAVRARLAALGFADVRARHLYHNREEITVVARRPLRSSP